MHTNLCRFVQSMIWNKQEAEDIISETILISYEKFDTINKKESLMYFMFSIASRLVKNKNRHKKFWGIFESKETKFRPSNNETDQNLIKIELYKALNKLSNKQREAIILFEINGFSIKEIAAIQHIGESGVKSNLKRGREKLMSLLSEHNPLFKQNENQILKQERIEYGR